EQRSRAAQEAAERPEKQPSRARSSRAPEKQAERRRNQPSREKNSRAAPDAPAGRGVPGPRVSSQGEPSKRFTVSRTAVGNQIARSWVSSSCQSIAASRRTRR